MIRLLILILFILMFSPTLFASATRSIDADAVKSSDHTKTFTMPAATGTLLLSTGTAALATSIAGGGANQVPYQTGAGATSFVSAGSQFQCLQAGSGGTPAFAAVNLGQAAAITGTLPLGNGGTGATTQSGAANAVLPSQTSQSGNFLTTNGTNVSWAAVSVTGGVKSTGSSIWIESVAFGGGSYGSVCSGTCTMYNNTGGFSSVTRNSAGNYSVNITSGVFSAKPVCTCSNYSAGTAVFNATQPQSATNVSVFSYNSGASASDDFLSITCVGTH